MEYLEYGMYNTLVIYISCVYEMYPFTFKKVVELKIKMLSLQKLIIR